MDIMDSYVYSSDSCESNSVKAFPTISNVRRGPIIMTTTTTTTIIIIIMIIIITIMIIMIMIIMIIMIIIDMIIKSDKRNATSHLSKTHIAKLHVLHVNDTSDQRLRNSTLPSWCQTARPPTSVKHHEGFLLFVLRSWHQNCKTS